jgi:hypothetical protein
MLYVMCVKEGTIWEYYVKFKFSHPIILSIFLISKYLNNPKVNLNLMFALNLGTIYFLFKLV